MINRLLIGLSVCLLVTPLRLGAQGSASGDDFSGRWAIVTVLSVGEASIGGTFELLQARNRISIIRRTSRSRAKITWSCALDHSLCTNTSEDGETSTSRARLVDGKLLISTRATDRLGRELAIERVIYKDSRGGLVVETDSPPDQRYAGRTVYRFCGKRN